MMPSVLWRCWLGGRKGIRLVKKTEWWGAGMVICLEQGADLLMAQLMPLLLTVSCFSKIQSGFTFLVPADLGSPGKGPLNGCVCVCLNHPSHPMGHGRQYVYDLSIRLYVRPCLGGGILWLACSGLLVNIAFRNHTFIIHALQCTLHLRLKNWPCYIIPHYVMCCCFCLQCFDAVGWAAARASSL